MPADVTDRVNQFRLRAFLYFRTSVVEQCGGRRRVSVLPATVHLYDVASRHIAIDIKDEFKDAWRVCSKETDEQSVPCYGGSHEQKMLHVCNRLSSTGRNDAGS